MTEPAGSPVRTQGASTGRGGGEEVAAATLGDAVPGTRAHVRRSLEGLRGVLVDARASQVASHAPWAVGEPLAGTATSAWRPPPHVGVQLRESIRAYARRLRAEGVPSERMLVLVKSVVNEAIPPELDAVEAPALTRALVRESIMAFYDFAPRA